MSTSPYIESPAVATALGVELSVICAFPELVRRGLLPTPISLGNVPKQPAGWHWDLQQVSSALASNRASVAATANDIAREIRAGGSFYNNPKI